MSKYDPMTGELISEENEEAVEGAEAAAESTGEAAEVAETKEVVTEVAATEEQAATEAENAEGKIIGYDPMTGEPIREKEQPQAPEMNFDPMTGKPIQKEAQAQPEMKFDPMTGKAIGQETATGDGKAPGKKKSKMPILVAVAVIAVVAIVIIVGITSGAFLSKRDKVLVAFANTFEKTKLIEKFDALGILASDSYTIAMEMGDDEVYFDVQLAVKGSEKQMTGNVSGEYMPEIEFLAGITASEVKIQLPDIDDNVLIYNYKEEKDGYITDILTKDEIAAIDTMCESLYSQKEQEDVYKELINVVTAEYKELEFEKVNKQEFEVNGKDRNCKGYKTTITEDNMMNFLDELEDVLAARYEDALDEMDVDLGDLFDDLRYEVEDMPDIELVFYIYKNKIACISMEVDREEIQLLFKGGEKGMPNIEMVYEDETWMELTGSVDGSKEVYEFEAYDSETVVLEYDYKSGDLVLEMENYYETIDIEANLQSDSKEFTFVLEEMEYDGYSEDIECIITVSKGASMQEFEGDEFDLGTADESDYEDLVDNIYSVLY